MKEILEEIGLENLDTLTKYPSIETFHEINKGSLNENKESYVDTYGDITLLVQEKIDGTNMRILMNERGYIVGSRNNLLSHQDDLIWNDHNSLKTKSFADDIYNKLKDTGIFENRFLVFYGELYGGNIGKASKQYSSDKEKFYFRIFDVASFQKKDCLELSQLEKSVVHKLREEKRSWVNLMISKENDLSPFFSKKDFVSSVGIIKLSTIDTNIDKVYDDFLSHFGDSTVKEDEKAIGKSEGVVVRDEKRQFIKKLRFEDYEKTFRKRKKAQ